MSWSEKTFEAKLTTVEIIAKRAGITTTAAWHPAPQHRNMNISLFVAAAIIEVTIHSGIGSIWAT